MKKILITLAIATLFTACGSNESKDMQTPNEIVADTTTNYNNSALTDTGTVLTTPVVPEETKKVTKTTTHTSTTPAPVTTTSPAPATTTTTTSTVNTQPVAAPVEEKKKGWSHAAKDAVIGGGAGAIGGAIISKKKAKGAIIGGAVGAAGGYILGRHKDKKDTLR